MKLLLLLCALGIAACGHRFGTALVVGESMEPTYANGDLLVLDRRAYEDVAPERGDVVLARTGGDIILKRVIGLPGEKIEVREGRLYVHGIKFPESGIVTGSASIRSGTLGPDRIALLGDNRSLPREQLVHAIATRDELLGRVAVHIGVGSFLKKMAGFIRQFRL
jgi:signal peptidase I